MATKARRLKTARRRRRQIAAALHALNTGDVTLEHVLDCPPPALARVSIYTIITHTYKMGPEGAKKCLTASKVWPEDKLGALTREQLQTIKKNLPPRAKYRDV